MKVRITITLDDEVRKALAAHYGQAGLATRATITAWAEGCIEATLQDITHDYEVEQEEVA